MVYSVSDFMMMQQLSNPMLQVRQPIANFGFPDPYLMASPGQSSMYNSAATLLMNPMSFSSLGMLSLGLPQTMSMAGLGQQGFGVGQQGFGLGQQGLGQGQQGLDILSLLSLLASARSAQTTREIGPPVTRTEEVPPIQGPEKTTRKGEQFEFSAELLNAVRQRPQDAKQLVSAEIQKTLGHDNDLTAILKDLTGEDVPTHDSNNRKAVLAYGLYNDIIDAYTKNVLAQVGAPADQPLGGDETKFDNLGGVILSRELVAKLSKTAPHDEADKLILDELSALAGSSSKAVILSKMLANGKLTDQWKSQAYFEKYPDYATETYANLVGNLKTSYAKG
jgi:hypothetical protein